MAKRSRGVEMNGSRGNASNSPIEREYFRRDQEDGISPPDLSKKCTFAEHIVHARGKRTQYTSVSLDVTRIRDMGDTTYKLKRKKTNEDGHVLIEHEMLIAELKRVIQDESEGERVRAVQALRYATLRKEGLVEWRFDISSVERKDLIAWAGKKVQAYFTKVK